MSKKFVAVVNKSGEIPRLFNALAHCTTGLIGGAVKDPDDLGLVTYTDAQGHNFDHITSMDL